MKLFLLLVFTLLLFGCEPEPSEGQVYRVVVTCPVSGKTLVGWADTREEIKQVKQELLDSCSLYDSPHI